MLENLKKNRSHRSFTEKEITRKELEQFIEGARVSATSMNSQRIRFFIVDGKENCDKVFPLIKFAGAIEWNPTIEESPRGYIAVCCAEPLNAAIESLSFDMGLCTQNILLMANNVGYSGCIIGAYNKPEFDKTVKIPQGYKSYYLIALGEPKDQVTIVEAKENNLKYYRDVNTNHHYVPKLMLEDLIIK
ncbi:nitroreductase family protein [Fusobacterium sp. PH5-44]|uniref:nitroreductase family protein n=1 Tax=unclassified Fusobacterium TaxID=2648384 RepID=UPI003D1AC752